MFSYFYQKEFSTQTFCYKTPTLLITGSNSNRDTLKLLYAPRIPQHDSVHFTEALMKHEIKEKSRKESENKINSPKTKRVRT